MNEIRINKMPAGTWRWLKLNDRSLKFPQTGEKGNVTETIAANVTLSDAAITDMRTGAGAGFEAVLADVESRTLTVPADAEAETSRINIDLENGQTVFAKYAVVAEKNAKSTVVFDLRSAADAEGYIGLETKVCLKEGSHVTLVALHRAGEGVTIINNIGGTCADNATLDVLHVVFSGKENDIGCSVALEGDNSALNVENAYFVEKDHRVDLNYHVPQTGKNTESNIQVNGVLRDAAFKINRMTIDFVKGATGAKGLENENVLLLGEDVVNQTVPTLLCNEEDVEGDHGCSVGRLDEGLMFYLKTRGFPEEAIYEMMSKAGLEAVFTKIPDQAIVEELLEFNEER